MNWLRYTRLSYAETREFSQWRSITGIMLIVIVCLVAGIISLSFSGKLKTCTATVGKFETAQVKEGGEGCKGRTVSLGEQLSMPSFTYVVEKELAEYRDEILQCKTQKVSATINLLSFAAPQFVWGYEISCSRPLDCCPAEIEKPPDAITPCFCDENLIMRIQGFSGSYKGSQIFNSAISNYSTLNNSVSDITQQVCPDQDPITVLRFDDTSYSAFSSSKLCSESTSNSTSDSIAAAVTQIKASVNDAISYDLKGLKLPGLDYVCYNCSRTHDLGQLLLDFLIAVSALGSITYSIVLWLLKVTQSKEPPPKTNLSMSQVVNDC